MKLSGNTILITGGSAGIGLALAKKFVELGNEVIITGRSQERLDAVLEEHPKLKGVRSDIADAKAIADLGREMKSRYPKLNVLINNAGAIVYRDVAVGESDLVALTSEVETNLCGTIRMVSALIDQIKANKGTIINVSSGLAWVPMMAAPIYCATKAAVHSYTLSLRNQLHPHGVEVIELAPPAVKTEATASMADNADVTLMSTDDLVAAVMKGLGKGEVEILPGQAKQLRFMSRLAPNFIIGQLAKASRMLIPGAR